ncbi:YebC/PmpR family DNA-binding transcriptional regulator [Guggenheimella bovis]
MGRIHNIEGRKNAQDTKRAGIFTKLGRAIMVAAREGGPDPEYNASLMSAIDKAKAANMPKDNIERAVKKGSGESDGAVYTQNVYEGYGPSGVAILVESLTDNTNRTSGEVRSYFTKNNGNLGAPGSVSYMFDHLGVLVIDKKDGMDEDEVMMQALDAGADDFAAEEDHFEVYTSVENFHTVREALKKVGFEFSVAELQYIPQTYVDLTNEADIKSLTRLIDSLEENDDVQNVYHNWNN